MDSGLATWRVRSGMTEPNFADGAAHMIGFIESVYKLCNKIIRRCDRSAFMRVFNLTREQEWNPKRHVEKILDRIGEGDVSVACWEPGQRSPYHCHPDATE